LFPAAARASATKYSLATATSGSLADMSSGTTQLIGADQDDTASAVTLIGFEFYLNGTRQDRFSVNSNGTLRFGTTSISTTLYDPLGQSGQSLITAYGADQRTHAGNGKVHFKVTGAAPNRVLIVEWLNMQANFNGGGTADLTYQVRLSETTGTIEFVYGSMAMSASGAADSNSQSPQIGFSSGNTVGSVGSITAAQSGTPAPTFDGTAATPVNNLYVAGSIPVLTSAADGSRRSFLLTPPVVNPPGEPLTFTGVSATGITLNWTDSSNELVYAIYNSTDGVNFSFVTTAAQNATSFAVTNLLGNTTYTWQLHAVTEGSTAFISGAQATIAPTPNASVGSGLWSSPGTWSTGSVPTSNDEVSIAAGTTVTIDTAAAAYSVSVAGTGTLQFEQTTARTLTVATDATVQSGATLQSNPAGTQTGHVLSITGNLTNNGTLDFSTNADTAGAMITFVGATNATFGGTGATTDLRTITINKGTSNASILELNPASFTVRGVTTDTVVGGWLVMTNGTIKISGTFAGTSRVFAVAAYNIPVSFRFWLNNPNYTVAAQNGNVVNNGLLQVSQGTFNQGTSNAATMTGAAGAVFTIEGGTVNLSGRFNPANAIIYNQSGGTFNVATVGNSGSGTTNGSFAIPAAATFNMTGGTINLVQASTGATPIDYINSSTPMAATGTLRAGTGATTTNFNFRLRGFIPNLVIDNTTNNKTATVTAQVNLWGSATINVGATMVINGMVCLVQGSTFTNNGTLTGTAANTRFYFLGGLGATTYTGTGVVTAPLAAWEVDNIAGVTIDPSVNQIVAARFNNFSGGLTGSGKLTLGNGGATTAVVQLGVAGVSQTVGGFDVPPIFNPGTAGVNLLYAPELTGRTTGNEMPPSRTLNLLSITTPNPITIAGGDVTVNGASAGALALGSARLITGPNTLYFNSAAGTVTRSTGYVEGSLKKAYPAAGSKTYEVGTASGYSPVTVNATAGTFPASFTVKAVQGPQPNVNPSVSLQRYWTLTGTGITADLTFQYLAGDVMGNESIYHVIQVAGGDPFSLATSTANAAAHTASATGLSSFSDFTVGQTMALKVANTSDSGAGSLRQALLDIAPGGTITFNIPTDGSDSGYDPVTGAYTFKLAGMELVLDRNLTINGPGADLLTISGEQLSRVFTINSGVTATLNGLTMANGLVGGAADNYGGGIYNNGTLNLANSALSGNSVVSEGNNYGGGIYNAGTLTVVNSTLSGNSASGLTTAFNQGGGIYNDTAGTAILTNSTLSGNSVTGGAVEAGGGIFNSGAVTLTNSTLAGNSASGGANSNVGGGIDNYGAGTVNASNTLIAGNTASSGGPDVSGAFTSQGHNLIGDTNGATIMGDPASDIVSPNPMLGVLASNGGRTQTIALLPGSPAIDAGADVTTLSGGMNELVTSITLADATAFPVDFLIQIDSEQMLVAGRMGNTLTVTRAANGTIAVAHPDGAGVNPAFDQRGSGAVRIIHSVADIGAFEAPVVETLIATQTANPGNSTAATFTFTGDSGGGPAIASFESRLDGGTFAPGTSPQSFSGLSEGSHTFEVRAIDVQGNVDATPASFTWVVDLTAPESTITANPPSSSNSTAASFAFSSNETGTFEMQLDGGGFAIATSPASFIGLSESSHTFEVRAIDAAGNTDATPASYTWMVDVTAPDTTITANPLSSSNSAAALFTFTSTEAGTFEVQMDGGGFTTSPASYSGLSDGSHTFQVRAIDAAGNVDPIPASFTWTVDTAPPTVMVSAPSVASASGGPVTYAITYADAGFNSSTLATGDVTLNKTGTADGQVGFSGTGNTRTVTISSITGNGTLSISLAAGTATDTAGNPAPAAGPSATFTVNNTPTIASATPAAILQNTASSVVLAGTNFLPGAQTVTFTPPGGSATPIAPTAATFTSLTVALPANLLANTGTGTITVTTAGGFATAMVSIVAPAIAQLSPASVPFGGADQTVTVTGSSFVVAGSSSATVRWTPNGGSPQDFTAANLSASSLSFTAPAALLANAGTATVRVLVGNAVSAPATFTITGSAPAITSASPASVPTGTAARTILLTGTGFVSGAQTATFTAPGGTAVPMKITASTTTSLAATIPAGQLANEGAGTIRVTTGGGMGSIAITIGNPAQDDSAFASDKKAIDIDVLANDAPVPGGTATITILTPPQHGTATVAAGQVRYAPRDSLPPDGDSFTYRYDDGTGGLGTATVTVVNFVAITGAYDGLIEDATAAAGAEAHQRAGYLRMTIGKTGSFSGVLTFAGTKLSPIFRHGFRGFGFTSKLGSAGEVVRIIVRRPNAPITLTLQYDADTGTITGNVASTDASGHAFAAPLVLAAKTHADALAGQYTLLIDPEATPASPQGTGFAAVKIKPSGAVTLNGRLADGTPFHSAAYLHTDQSFPIYAGLYAGGFASRGSLRGTVQFPSAAPLLVGDASGLLGWFKPRRLRDASFPEGFELSRAALLAHYQPPTGGTRVLALDPVPENGRTVLDQGGFTAIDQVFTLPPSNTAAVSPPNVSQLTLHLAASTGLFRGTFLHPTTGQVTRFSGAVVQADASGSGYFLGTGPTDGGAVELGKK
jgi:hypothetical protein